MQPPSLLSDIWNVALFTERNGKHVRMVETENNRQNNSKNKIKRKEEKRIGPLDNKDPRTPQVHGRSARTQLNSQSLIH